VLRSSEHFFFRLSDPRCVDFLREWTQSGRLQPEVANKAREWLGRGDDKALGDWDISRDAPYFGIPIPDAPGKYFYVWLDAPIGYLASLKKHFDAAARRWTQTFEQFLADPGVEQYHFIGKDIIYFHTLFWPAMLKFSGRKVPDNVYVHGFITVSAARRCRRAAAPASARCATSTRHEPRVAALLHRRQAERRTSRTSTSIRTTSSRASTATWSASTSTSPAGRPISSPGCSRAGCPAPAGAGRALRAPDDPGRP
jgi:hypothetical protein